jgi:hypothetical protein
MLARRQAKLAKKAKTRKARQPVELANMMADLTARRLEEYAEIEALVLRAVSPAGLDGEPFTAAAVIRQVSLELDHIAESRAQEAAKIAELEAEGWRIVDGGSTSGERWETTDWRTGDVLARGKTFASYEEHEPPPSEKWFHIDQIYDETFSRTETVDGLPERFAAELIEWTCENEERAKQLVGR